MESGGLNNSDCILCQIIDGKMEKSVVYEDDIVIAIMDIRPINLGHVLIFPKKHFPYMNDMDENTGKHLFTITQHIAKAIRQSGVKCEGINLFLADGKAAFQEVMHLHMHVFPRFKGDPFGFTCKWELKPSREELNEIAEMIKSASKL